MERLLKSRYKIGEKISENPFSVSYKGSFLSGNKPVIIKIYKRGTLSSNLIKTMKQKVKDFSLINYHGIAKLIDGDYGWQGFYYVREYIEGQTLAEILSSGSKIGIEKSLAIVEEICKALSFAHQRGIIHGALKPSNVIINNQGVVKLADFVIEGEIKEALPQKALALMNDGKYSSPEELTGQASGVSADIFALGLILYELAGSNVLEVDKGLPTALKKLRKVALVDRAIMANLPKYLQDIINKALQIDPALRFFSAEEFRNSLEKKTLINKGMSRDEFAQIFESTVTQYGEEDLSQEKEELEDLGRLKLRWAKESHRNWILALLLGLAVISGLLYAFLIGI